MAEIVVTGSGVVGLCTAMLLANEGNQVSVLERDPAEPVDDPTEAWEGWERRGVNQFRLLHYFQPRFRLLAEANLPAVVAELDRVGATRHNVIALAPEQLTGGMRDGDDVYEALTGRRPVVESALARVAAATPGVTVRRGVPVTGLVAGTPAAAGVPHVVGVRTEAGEEIAADLVVDVTGRRSPLPGWLDALGARPPIEELEDSGFVYYGRHFRSADASLPAMFGPLLQDAESMSLLTLPADNGTWGLGLTTSARDAELRALRDVDAWTRVVAAFPLAAHWLDGEALDDNVIVMAKIEDRFRRYVVDDAPVVTGVVAVGDSWACTNPSLGRGASMGLLHAVALRDVLAGDVLDDPVKLVAAFDQATEQILTPWYRGTLEYDRARLAELEASMSGEAYEPGEPGWEIGHAFASASMKDGDVLRARMRVAGVLEPPDEVIATPGLLEKIIELGAGWRDDAPLGPTRAQTLAAIAG